MATKRAIELGRRRDRASSALMKELEAREALTLGAWAKVRTLERAAIAVGEERERGRQAKASRSGLPKGFTRMLPDHLKNREARR